jgi:hypothetical protein
MRYIVPVFLWIEAPTPSHADAAKQAVEKMLIQDPSTSAIVNSMISARLSSLGIGNLGISVGEPKTPPTQKR